MAAAARLWISRDAEKQILDRAENNSQKLRLCRGGRNVSVSFDYRAFSERATRPSVR